MRPFEYVEPASLEDAVAVLGQLKDDACAVLAGGTDLLVMMQQDKIRPRHVVNVAKLPGLDGIVVEAGRGVRIGSLATVRSLERSSELAADYPIIGEAVRFFGGVTIRNMATIGGNLARGNPSADLPPVLVVLDARIRVVGPSGERTIPVEEFFVGPGATVLQPDEILTEVEIPEPPTGAGTAYQKQCMRGVDLATVGVAALVVVEPSSRRCREARLCFAGAAAVPLRCREAEKILRGAVLTDAVVAQAAEAAAAEARPREGSFRADPVYRRRLLRALTIKMVKQAAAASQERGS
jgi:CO/xanthine dehydrogenase FAD-binding subunit